MKYEHSVLYRLCVCNIQCVKSIARHYSLVFCYCNKIKINFPNTSSMVSARDATSFPSEIFPFLTIWMWCHNLQLHDLRREMKGHTTGVLKPLPSLQYLFKWKHSTFLFQFLYICFCTKTRRCYRFYFIRLKEKCTYAHCTHDLYTYNLWYGRACKSNRKFSFRVILHTTIAT